MEAGGDEKIRLRALTKEDAKVSWKWRNEEELKYFYSGHPFFINIEKEEEWMSNVILSDMPQTSFGIEELCTGSLVGMSFLRDINLIHRTAEFSLFIGDESAMGKGYGTEATRKTVEFAFRNLNLNRLFSRVIEGNHGSISILEKSNFKHEGVLRENVYKNGRYRDQVIMSLLRAESFCKFD